ncbi:MAG: M23 family metallopeptidase [Candidatus Roizmanbacteria bacterium]|nr:M23 family metallopeptidase [Candidatus Roizmanbacteria bacterium]
MNARKNITIDFPLRGEWVFLNPPGHHPYAFDFMKIDKGKKNYSDGSFLNFIFGRIPVESFYGWSQPILAPIEGVVIQASDDWPDNTMVNLINTVFIWLRATFLFRPKINGSKIDIRPNVGNYVMIQSETGEIVFLAHMRSGSVKVVVGQRVAVGQIIGEVGNSGNTTAPHLHINLFDQMDNPLQVQVLPFVFRYYERKNGSAWGAIQHGIPQKGEIVRL